MEYVSGDQRREEIDHTIDVRYEDDLVKAFDKFIEKWCGEWYPHLIDTDENDGQFMREKIDKARKEERQKVVEEIAEKVNLIRENTSNKKWTAEYARARWEAGNVLGDILNELLKDKVVLALIITLAIYGVRSLTFKGWMNDGKMVVWQRKLLL